MTDMEMQYLYSTSEKGCPFIPKPFCNPPKLACDHPEVRTTKFRDAGLHVREAGLCPQCWLSEALPNVCNSVKVKAVASELSLLPDYNIKACHSFHFKIVYLLLLLFFFVSLRLNRHVRGMSLSFYRHLINILTRPCLAVCP